MSKSPVQNRYQLNRVFILVSVSIVLLTFFSGCASPSPEIVEVTRVVPQTVIVTQLVEIVITATPIPPTSTPAFTSTPEATPTPQFILWNSQQVLEAFIAAGLEAETARPMTPDDYGIAPLVAIEGTRFFIPSLCDNCGGRIMSFSTQEDLEAVQNYYNELSRSSAMFFSWVFVRDNILVQINGDLPEASARQYESVLNEMR
jgi:hypothetical protein